MKRYSLSARAATSQDETFLTELFFEVRAPEFELADLSDSQLHFLLAQKFEALRSETARNFPNAIYWIIEGDGVPVGYQVVSEDAEIRLIEIAVCPRHRNRGIGTASIRQLLDEATQKGKPIILIVEIFNPARRLLERMGFEECGDEGIYKRMRWTAGQAAAMP